MSQFKSLRVAAVAAAAALSCSFAFAASDTATLTVNANVSGVCKLTVAGGPMAFTLDPSINATATSTAVTASVKCTKGITPTSFTVGGSSSGTYTSGGTAAAGDLLGPTAADLIQYSIGWTAPTFSAANGFGSGSTSQDVSLTGSVPYANFANAAAGAYTTTVQLAVNY